MQKIFLLMKYYLNSNHSFPKFDYQIEALKEMGYDVYYFGIDDNKIFLCSNKEPQLIHSFSLSKTPGLKHIKVYNELYKATIQLFEEITDFQFVYIRYMPTTFNFSTALRLIKKSNSKIIVEFPTHPIEKEIKAEKRLFRKVFFLISKFYFDTHAKKVDLFSVIGEETYKYLNRSAVNIQNGISLKKIPVRNQSFKKEEIHLLGLANMAKWHGFDRVIEGLKEYYSSGGDRIVIFHLVGPDGDGSLEIWKKMVSDYKLDKYVIFEGPKYGDELDYYFNVCQVAIGSIALHRIGYESAATLKIREYMARGIPFVMSVDDQSIKTGSNFYYEASSDDIPINMSALIEYIDQIENWDQMGFEMREFASKALTWNSQFERVFETLNNINS